VLREYAKGRRDFRDARLRGLNLWSKTLTGCDFRGSDLTSSRFHYASLIACDFSEATLHGASMLKTTFVDSSFEDADLSTSYLAETRSKSSRFDRTSFLNSLLSDVTFANAELSHTSFRGCCLQRVSFEQCTAVMLDLDDSVCVDMDLGLFCEQPTVPFRRGCSVDWRSVVRSVKTQTLERFLLAGGMHEGLVSTALSWARRLGPENLFDVMRSTFISYGSPDIDFARKLEEALQRAGVRTFFFEKDAIPGQRLHRVMREGVNEHDRVVLICSRASLERPGVLNELEETLEREARSGGASFLIPITLDDYVFEWSPPASRDVAQAVRDRVVADFRGADSDPALFDRAVRRLLRALER